MGAEGAIRSEGAIGAEGFEEADWAMGADVQDGTAWTRSLISGKL